MKTLQTIIIAIFLVASQVAAAQGTPPAKNNQENREKIEAMKVSYLTEKLSLTPEEAQKFWPVYNKYKAEMKEIRKANRTSYGEGKPNIETMSEKELTAYTEQRFITEQKILDVKKKYDAEFKKVLPIKKVALLYASEEQFKRELLKQMKGNKPADK